MKLLTRTEAAERCRVSLAAFDAHVRPGLTPKRIGRRVLFLESDLDAWAESPSNDAKTKRRALKKHGARDRRLVRRELVHAAGCHLRHDGPSGVCGFRQRYLGGDVVGPGGPVSVPRSLRPYLGRWIGGAP